MTFASSLSFYLISLLRPAAVNRSRTTSTDTYISRFKYYNQNLQYCQDFLEFFIALHPVDLLPQPGRSMQPFGIPCHMLAHLPDAQIAALIFDLQTGMAEHRVPDLIDLRPGRDCARLFVCRQF